MPSATRIISAILLLALLGVLLWNTTGPVSLDDVDDTYIGIIRTGDLEGRKIDATGVSVLRSMIEQQTRPSFNPIRILREQLWYNAVTEGYDLQIWMEPSEYTSGKEQYAIYQKGKLLFLRIEYARRNRVLVADFTTDAVEEAVATFLLAE